MKTALDPRHQKRIRTMQALFSHSFQKSRSSYIQHILPNLAIIDQRIRSAAPEWPIEKIAKIDLAILRLAVYELSLEIKEPPKVVIDEAIELAKAYGNEHSQQFVNGVLGTILTGKDKGKSKNV